MNIWRKMVVMDTWVLQETVFQRRRIVNADELWMQVKSYSRSLLKHSIPIHRLTSD